MEKQMKQIRVTGAGYVGLVTSACFADLGNQVVCVDINDDKINQLNRGEIPIYEPGLKGLVTRNATVDRPKFTTSCAEALAGAEFAIICVGTSIGRGYEG